MAKKASAAPISTNLSASGGNTNLPWQIWLRETSQSLIDASTTAKLDNVQYILNGSICFVMFSGNSGNGNIKLPYSASNSKMMQCFVSGASVPTYARLASKSDTLTVTPNVTIEIMDWYPVVLAI